MRVLFVCGGNNPEFETAPFIVRQAESLRRAGLEADIFTIKGRGMLGYLRQVKPLRRIIKSGSYDLVHAHYTLSGWVARLASFHKPLVVSYMGTDFAGFFRNDGRRKAKSIFMILQGMMLNIFTRNIIVKSEQQLKLLPLKRRAAVIPNGVDFETFKPVDIFEARQKLGLQTDEKLVLFLGNPDDPRKNFRLANEAFTIVRNKIEATLVVPYPLNPNDVCFWLNAADLLLFTSFYEGSSNLLKEAMACNCPVVTTPAGDAANIVSGAEQCHVVGYDATDVSDKVLTVLRSGKRSNGREKTEHLKDSVVAAKITGIYRRATRERKRGIEQNGK